MHTCVYEIERVLSFASIQNSNNYLVTLNPAISKLIRKKGAHHCHVGLRKARLV